jgi:hypothetical protein
LQEVGALSLHSYFACYHVKSLYTFRLIRLGLSVEFASYSAVFFSQNKSVKLSVMAYKPNENKEV